MRVFVTGGTGAVGRFAVPALVAAGHRVSALARSDASAASLAAQGVSPVRVSLFDVAALTAAFAGHDSVVNLATAIPPASRALRTSAWAPNQRIRTEGSAAVVDAALAAGVGRVVQESVVLLYADGGDRWLDEDAPTEAFPVARGSVAAEASVERFAAGGGAGTVLRFGLFSGPGTQAADALALARHHVGQVYGRAEGYVSVVEVSDAAAAMVAALTAPPGRYNVVDDEPLTKRAYVRALADAAGTRPWVRAPGRAALLFGDRTTALTRSLRVSNARLRAASDWRPRHPSAREGLRALAAAG